MSEVAVAKREQKAITPRGERPGGHRDEFGDTKEMRIGEGTTRADIGVFLQRLEDD